MTQDNFNEVISLVLEILNRSCREHPEWYKKSGEEFEPIVVQAMEEALDRLGLSGKIDYIPGGHRFPDIVLRGSNGTKFGVEVKSSTSSGRSWKINGNSVMGTTKEDGIKECVIVFGKLRGENSEFRARNYEQSVSSVGVTHSPRYLIDLELPEGESFFEKSGITYAQLNSTDNPIKCITDYYYSIGQKAWWLAESTPAAIRMFGDLPRQEQNYLMGYAFAHFPEIFSDSSNKFYRCICWLVSEKSIVDSSLRDRFTAGGKVDLDLCGKKYRGIPRVFGNLKKYKEFVLKELDNADLVKLSKDWNCEAAPDYGKRIYQLVELICTYIVDGDLNGINKFELIEDILCVK